MLKQAVENPECMYMYFCFDRKSGTSPISVQLSIFRRSVLFDVGVVVPRSRRCGYRARIGTYIWRSWNKRNRLRKTTPDPNQPVLAPALFRQFQRVAEYRRGHLPPLHHRPRGWPSH